MKITMFVQRFPVLSETFIVRKVVALAQAGHDVTVVALSRPNVLAHEDDLAPVYRQIRIIYLPSDHGAYLKRVMGWLYQFFSSWLRSPSDFRLLWNKTQIYKEFRLRLYRMRRIWGLTGLRSDIFHFENYGIAAYFLDVMDSFAYPSVVSFRNISDVLISIDKQRESELRQVVFKASQIHCVNESVAVGASQFGERNKIFINYPSIDPVFFKPGNGVDRDDDLIVTVSRLHWKKGIPYALQAIASLKPEFPNLRYVIIGEGDEEDAIRFEVADLGISDQVHLYGRGTVTQIRDVLARATVFVLPSVSEGISNAVLEAMSMEVPVVTTNAGGMPEAITDGVEGFVVPRRNSSAIAARIAILLRNPAMARTMGEKARRRVLGQFTLERQTSVFLDKYERLMNEIKH